jgi:hypothetical protein
VCQPEMNPQALSCEPLRAADDFEKIHKPSFVRFAASLAEERLGHVAKVISGREYNRLTSSEGGVEFDKGGHLGSLVECSLHKGG